MIHLKSRPQVIVIGGGLAGLSVAWHLAPTHRVLVLEMGEQPGAEASAQNAGMLRRMGEDPYERALAMRTHDWLTGPLPQDWEISPARATGAVLALACDPDHLSDAAAHLRARGVALEELARPEEAAPVLKGAPIARAYHLPEELVVDAHQLISGFLRGLRRMGGSLHTQARVVDIDAQGVRLASGEHLPAPHVVIAAGAWSGVFGRVPLIPVRRALLHTGPHPLSSPEHPWTWIDDVGVYARPEGGGWLLSACDERVDYPPMTPGSQGPVPEATRALLSHKLERWLPALAGLRVGTGWTGLRTFAPDRRPLLGPDPSRPGLWWATGLGGAGVSCSVGVGQAMSAWIQGRSVPWLHAPGLAPGRTQSSRWLIRPDGDLRHARLTSSHRPR